MCFSAQASFAAGAVLMGAGVAAMRKTGSPSQLLFAGIPLLFSIQQFSEGFLWLSQENPVFASLEAPATHFFFFIGSVVWPVWVPVSIWMVEPNARRRKGLLLIMGIGAIIALYGLVCMLSLGVVAQVDCSHIMYIFSYPLDWPRKILYIMAVAPPFFVSSWKNMRFLGFMAVISVAVTQVFYAEFAFSVWCFFAAILSVLFLWVLVVNVHPETGRNNRNWIKAFWKQHLPA